MISLTHRTLPATMALALIVAACGAGSNPTPTPTPAPTATPTPAPTPAPTATAVAMDVSTFTGAPGRFVWDGFQKITVDIGDGWGGADTAEDYFDLVRGSGDTATAAMTVNTFGGTTYRDACVGAGTEVKGDSQSVQTFFDYLSSIPALTVSDLGQATVAGYQGMSAAIATKTCDGGRIWLWQTPITGDFHLINGEAAKIWAVDVRGTTVVITAEGFHGDQDLSEMLPSVDAILSSMTIEAP